MDFKDRKWWPQNQFSSELQLQRWTHLVFCESVTTKLSYQEVLTFLWVWTLQLMQMNLILTSCVHCLITNYYKTKQVIYKETFCLWSIYVCDSLGIMWCRNIFHDQNCFNKSTTPIKRRMTWHFIYLCIKYKLMKECGKKFPSVFTRREREKVGNVPWLPIQR